MSTWYTKIRTASAKDDVMDEVEDIITSLEEAIIGCNMDKKQSKDAVDVILSRIEKKKGERLIINHSIQQEIKGIITDIKDDIWDSPYRFSETIKDVIAILDGYLYDLQARDKLRKREKESV